MLTADHPPCWYLEAGNDEPARSFLTSPCASQQTSVRAQAFPDHPVPTGPASQSFKLLYFCSQLLSPIHIYYVLPFSHHQSVNFLTVGTLSTMFIVLNEEGLANSTCSINIRFARPEEDHHGTVCS